MPRFRKPTVRAVTTAIGFAVGIAVLGMGPFAAKAAELNVRADVKNLQGETIGSVLLRDTPSGQVLATISATGITPGWHGVHIHETGKCDASTGFKSAGGHLASGKSHGVLSGNGPHPGDLPNQMVQAGGKLVAEIYVPMEVGQADLISDADGSAFVIHSGRDDYTSQPSGAAGNRIACGVFEPAQ